MCCELSTTIFAEQLQGICYVLTIVIPSIQSLGDVTGNMDLISLFGSEYFQ